MLAIDRSTHQFHWALRGEGFTGEQIFYGEFDGGRKKRVLVKIIGE
jgi:hypothetical protein